MIPNIDVLIVYKCVKICVEFNFFDVSFRVASFIFLIMRLPSIDELIRKLLRGQKQSPETGRECPAITWTVFMVSQFQELISPASLVDIKIPAFFITSKLETLEE